MASKAASILPCWRAIQLSLRSASGRWVYSARISTAASSRPSARASQHLTSERSRPEGGSSRQTGVIVSRYSTMTRESKTAPPSSMIRQGTLPSGLESWMRVSAAHTFSCSNW